MDTSAMVNVNDKNYAEIVEKSQKPVILAIGASWCPDCQRVAPLLNGLAKHHREAILFACADIDLAVGIKTKFNICAIPTLIIIKGGQIVDTLIDPTSVDVVQNFVALALDE